MQHATAGVPMNAALQSLLRVAPSAVMTIDRTGRVTNLNPQAERLFSTSVEAAVGRMYQLVLGPSLADRLVGLFLREMRSPSELEPQLVRATLPDGRRVDLRANIGPISDPGGGRGELLFVAGEVAGNTGAETVPERLRTALRRYLGDELAAMIEARPSFIGVGGVRRRVSVLHADIRGYTTTAERQEPEETTLLLLRYHGHAVEALQRAGATLDRFIGDSVLAIWNAPNDVADHARASLSGALAMRRATAEAGNDLAYGIAVHSGDAVVGNIGSGRFMNYTAVGDTVNVAARLQAEAAGGQILCSAQVLHAAQDGFEVRSLGAIRVRGRSEPVESFELIGMHSEVMP